MSTHPSRSAPPPRPIPLGRPTSTSSEAASASAAAAEAEAEADGAATPGGAERPAGCRSGRRRGGGESRRNLPSWTLTARTEEIVWGIKEALTGFD